MEIKTRYGRGANTGRPAGLRMAAVVSVAALAGGGLVACGDDNGGGEDGEVTLTMWTRAATVAVSQGYADAYEEATGIHVDVTEFPNEEYTQRLAAAAGAGELPDVFGTDVVFAAQFAAEGLFVDITDRLAEFEFADQVAPAHVDAGVWEGSNYVVPHTIDMSVMFYNIDLYEQAGLDPEAPPTSLREFAEHARALDELGEDVHGTYFGGNCGGCTLFTFWPSVWAAGGEVLSADGFEATIDSPEMAEVFAFYRGLYEEGVAAPASEAEPGDSWLETHQAGNIGIAPGPSVWLPLIEEAGVNIGVAPITGIDGGDSTFIGGDSAGISVDSEHPDEAWDFLAWTMSEEAQVEVVASQGLVPTRTDLADNQYSSEDPRLVTMNQLVAVGRTPYARNFNAAFNDPQSPWTEALRGALFGDNPQQALAEGNAALTAVLQQQ